MHTHQTSNNGASKYLEQKLIEMKEAIQNSTIMLMISTLYTHQLIELLDRSGRIWKQQQNQASGSN